MAAGPRALIGRGDGGGTEDECGRWMGSEVGVGRGKEAGASEEGLYVFTSMVRCWCGEGMWFPGGEREQRYVRWERVRPGVSRREDGRERERGRSVHSVGVWMGWWCVRLGVCWGHQGWWSGRRVSGCECAGASCIGKCGAGKGWGYRELRFIV